MNSLNIDQILRYVISGVVAIFIVFVIENDIFSIYPALLKGTDLLLVILSFGILYYSVYHSLIYRYLVIRLKDKFRNNNLRKYMIDSDYFEGIDDKWKAENFYYLIRETCFQKNERKVTHFHGAGIHLLYICASLFLFGIIASIITSIICTKDFNWPIIGSFAFVSLLTLIVGIINDLTLERKEFALLIHIEKSGKYYKMIKHFLEAYKTKPKQKNR